MLRWVLLVTLVLAGCREKKVTPDDGQLSVRPAMIDLGAVWAGFPVSRTASVAFSGMSSCDVTLSASAPFTVTPSVHLEKASSANVTVSVSTNGAGMLSGTLTVNGCGHTVTAALSASSFAVPDCGSGGACTTVHFDPDAGLCATSPKPDGLICVDPCLDQPHCQSGDCVGTSMSCDDTDPCTIDACSLDGGCVHIPGQGLCPPLPGCTVSCDGGHCGTLAQIWSHTTPNQPLDPLVADPRGNVYWLEDDGQLDLSGWLESVSRSGVLRYKAGVLLVGSEAWPMYTVDEFVYLQANGDAVFGVRGSDGSLLWGRNLREEVSDAGHPEAASQVARVGRGAAYDVTVPSFLYPISFSDGSGANEGFAVAFFYDSLGLTRPALVLPLIAPPYALELDETQSVYASVQSSSGYIVDAYSVGPQPGQLALRWSAPGALGPVLNNNVFTSEALLAEDGGVLASFAASGIAPDIATTDVAVRRDVSFNKLVFFDPLTGVERGRAPLPDLANWDVYALTGNEVLAVNRSSQNRVDGFDLDGGHIYQCDVPIQSGTVFGSSVLIDNLLLMWTHETNGYVLHAYAMPGRREAPHGWVTRYGSAARTNRPK